MVEVEVLELLAPANYGNCCRNCGKLRAHFARGLCRGCWQRKSIREQFPQIKLKKENPYLTQGKLVLPEHATDALPGTEAKILVLQQRAAEGTLLFHPLDVKSGD